MPASTSLHFCKPAVFRNISLQNERCSSCLASEARQDEFILSVQMQGCGHHAPVGSANFVQESGNSQPPEEGEANHRIENAPKGACSNCNCRNAPRRAVICQALDGGADI